MVIQVRECQCASVCKSNVCHVAANRSSVYTSVGVYLYITYLCAVVYISTVRGGARKVTEPGARERERELRTLEGEDVAALLLMLTR